MNSIFVLLLSLFLPEGLIWASPMKDCLRLLSSGEQLAPRSSSVDATESLIGYLQALLERSIIGEKELLGLLEGLDRENVGNPINDIDAVKGAGLLIHHQSLSAQLSEARAIDRARLKSWANAVLRGNAVAEAERNDARDATKDVFKKIKFLLVGGRGSFAMNDGGETTAVVLTHQIEAMSVPVTQYHWVEIMGANPSTFANGAHAVELEVRGKQIKMQPDHPIESVTWWSAVIFANVLSEQQGLLPAYDVSGIEFIDGALPPHKRTVLRTPKAIFTVAAKGTLRPREHWYNQLVIPKINAPGGNIYKTSGYRLPTEAEQEYLLRAGGAATGLYYFGDDVLELPKHGWSGGAHGSTEPVAQLKPLIINGRAFYDLYGNVQEWGNDWFGDLQGGVDPMGPSDRGGSGRVVRGGAWAFSAIDLRAGRRAYSPPDERDMTIGFRLVRTLDP